MALPPKNLPLCTHRYMLFVSYLGSKYNGSQRLVNRETVSAQNTIQETLEWSLESFLPKKRCRITACSRTDKGVHALMNCYTLPLMDFSIPTERLKRLVNFNLYKHNHDISVNEVLLVPAEFHPMKSALGREYIYRLAVLDNQRHGNLREMHAPQNIMHLLPVTELYKVLPVPCFNFEKALKAVELLSGQHDFASFSMAHKDYVQDTIRHLEIDISNPDPVHIDDERPFKYSLYHLRFKSRSFLHNQVRRMVGAILSYASYQSISLDDIKYLLDKPDKKHWGSNMIIAEPWGLFLSRINYDSSSFKGTLKTFEDEHEVTIDPEGGLPAAIGLINQQQEVDNSPPEENPT